MRASLDYRETLLCVLVENGTAAKEWFPVNKADRVEVQGLIGRPVTRVNKKEGVYVDEEGSVYQLADKGETKPLKVEREAAESQADLAALLQASLRQVEGPARTNGWRKTDGNRKYILKNRATDSGCESTPSLELHLNGTSAVCTVGTDDTEIANSEPLNLRQKLALVRRRLGYIQKRGHNERHNYNYVTAADLAGSVGDILAELGVVMIPQLQSISTETPRSSTDRIARVIMNYRFLDAATGDELTVSVAGEGADAGDKAPYKAMTGALKYALLQSFLIATGDDPENESARPNSARPKPRTISELESKALRELLEQTGPELERVLEYYKVSSLEEMTEATYRRAMETLKRKRALMEPREANSNAQS